MKSNERLASSLFDLPPAQTKANTAWRDFRRDTVGEAVGFTKELMASHKLMAWELAHRSILRIAVDLDIEKSYLF